MVSMLKSAALSTMNYVRSLLEAMYDPQTIYRSGFTVHTTLDPALQDEAERLVGEQVKSLAEQSVTDGALVALRPTTGEILAMVGSADFYDEVNPGQVNMAIRPRQPGSSTLYPHRRVPEPPIRSIFRSVSGPSDGDAGLSCGCRG